jgi:hypothetical protein
MIKNQTAKGGKAEGRRQKAEGRRQKAEGRRQKAEGRRQKEHLSHEGKRFVQGRIFSCAVHLKKNIPTFSPTRGEVCTFSSFFLLPSSFCLLPSASCLSSI